MTEKGKIALIFGINGQTGSYLAEILLAKNYTVHGVIRRTSTFNTERLLHLFPKIRDNLHYGDVIDSCFIFSIIQKLQPDEVYNLAAQSHVMVSFENPLYTCSVDAIGTVNILEAIRSFHEIKKEKSVKFYQAGTSEMYGGLEKDYEETMWANIKEKGMNEKTPMYPKSPYACAKLFSYNMVQNYRDAYGIWGGNGICFNHESERRDPRFVTRKVTRTVARIHLGLDTELILGNLNAKRDWGHAKDYAEGIYASLQLDKPIDVVFATGQSRSIKELVECAFSVIKISLRWEGTGKDEIGVDVNTNRVLVRVSEKYYRPNEVNFLKGDATLAKNLLGWEPKIQFEKMIENMVLTDLKTESRARLPA
jgi:GDPmannose 4,6-dehydratase